MPRNAATHSISDVINDSVRAVVADILPSLQRSFKAAVDARVRAELAGRKPAPRRRAASYRRAGELTRWVADNRARRVPTFVIQATGLDTKKKIVAKYGANAAFAKNKPLPPVRFEAAKRPQQNAKLAREVKARLPVIRKAAGATK